jgi:hypothetical protein
MKAFIAKFLPNLIPGLGAFANPWVLLGLLAALVSSFFYGVHMEAGRFESFKAQVKVVGDAQEKRAAQRGKDNKQLKKDADDDYKAKNAKLAASNAALVAKLQRGPGGSVLPARQQPVAPGSPDTLCFDRPELDGALRAFTAGAAGLVGEGEALKLKLDTGIDWVEQQRKLK